MPIIAGSNSLSTEDWLAVTKHMNISFALNCEPAQYAPEMAVEPAEEPIFGSHAREAAITVKKLLSRWS
jgi:hypothetical protein